MGMNLGSPVSLEDIRELQTRIDNIDSKIGRDVNLYSWSDGLLDIPGQDAGEETAASDGENLYVVRDSADTTKTYLDILDLQENTWVEKEAPLRASQEPSADIADGVLYISQAQEALADGGMEIMTDGGVGSALAYDIDSETFTEITGTTASQKARSASYSEEYYLTGGNDGGDAGTKTFRKYDPSNDEWITLPDMNTARIRHGCTATENYIYVVAGQDTNAGGDLASCERFDFSSNSWETIQDYPAAVRGLTAVTIDGVVFAYGGVTEKSKLYSYNDKADSWEERADGLIGVSSHGAAEVDNGMIVCGGLDSTDSGSKYVFGYTR